MERVIVEPTGSIMAIPLCDADCCGGRGVFTLRGTGHAMSGGRASNTYRSCELHFYRLVTNMFRDAPGTDVTVTRASWAT